MIIKDIVAFLDAMAPLSLQEDYDNAGLITGDVARECTGVLCTLDVTEAVIEEAIQKNCNCIVAHHPFIFRGLKKITGDDFVGRTVIAAIRNDIAVYASHTNLDNLREGVNAQIAAKLGLTNTMVMQPLTGSLRKLYTFVPPTHLDKVREALFAVGGGKISGYSECSFTHPGVGTFLPGEGSNPFSGQVGKRENADEIKLELIFPHTIQAALLGALRESHPYEEVAFDVIKLENDHQGIGAGLIGDAESRDETSFLEELMSRFSLSAIRHAPFTGKPVKRVAVCGGAGSFLIARALQLGADAFVTSDVKYHEFFAADGRLFLCDIGHYESEQFTTDLLASKLLGKFPTFAVLKSVVATNPVRYFTGK